jgi:hypothetical protein
MPWSELILVAPAIKFHEDARSWYEPTLPALGYDIVRPDPGNDDAWIAEEYEVTSADSAMVESISVYGPDSSPFV